MKKSVLAGIFMFLMPMLLNNASAWSIDGVCDNTLEAEKILNDFTAFHGNYTMLKDTLNSEMQSSSCAYVSEVYNGTITMFFNLTCLYSSGDKTMQLGFDDEFYSCKQDGSINTSESFCPSGNWYDYRWNVSDWRDYDYLVFEVDSNPFESSHALDKLTSSLIYADLDEFYGNGDYSQQANDEFYNNRYEDGKIFLISTLRNITGLNSWQFFLDWQTGTTYTGWNSWISWDYWNTNSSNFRLYQQELKFKQFGRIEDYPNEWVEINISAIKLVREENRFTSPDCAVQIEIPNLLDNYKNYSGSYVNVTGYRLPTNLPAFSEMSYVMRYKHSSIPFVRQLGSIGIADGEGNFLPISDYYSNMTPFFENVSMFDEINIIAGINAYGGYYPAYIYSLQKTGNNYAVEYEEIPDLWQYMKDNEAYHSSYNMRGNETSCIFAKALLKSGDFWNYKISETGYDIGYMYIFSSMSEDYCGTGIGCAISFNIPFNKSLATPTNYDLIMLGGLCNIRDTDFAFYPVGIAYDEFALRQDGICSLEYEYEYYKGDFQENACRIMPTFYASYMQDASNRFNPIVLGFLAVSIILLLSVYFAGKIDFKLLALCLAILVIASFIYYIAVDKGLVDV